MADRADDVLVQVRSFGDDRLRALEAAIAHTSEAILVWDYVDGAERLAYVNAAFCDLTGWTADEAVAHGSVALVDRSTDPGARERFNEGLRATGSHSETVALLRKDGSAFWAVLTYVLTRDESGEPWGAVGLCRDVSDRIAAEEAQERVDEWAAAITSHANDVVVVVNRDGVITYASASIEAVLGWPPDGVVGTNWFDLVAAADRERMRAAIVGEVQGIDAGSIVVACLHNRGGTRRLRIEAEDYTRLDAVAGIVLSGRDVTEWTDAEELLSAEAGLLETIARGVDLSTVLSGVSELVERHLPGVAASVGVMEDDGVIRHRTAPSLPPALIEFLDATTPGSALGRTLRAPGVRQVIWDDIPNDELWMHARSLVVDLGFASCWSLNVHDATYGELLGCLVVFHPEPRPPTADELRLLDRCRHLAAIAVIHERAQSRLTHLALHDALTGLPNRTLVFDRIERALSRSRRRRSQVAVLFVDLDQFKVINDSLGHEAGDHLLEEVAERILTAVRSDDTVGRFGGDEFVVLCEEVDGEPGAVEIAERIADALLAPIMLADAEVVITASIGIAVATETDSAPGSLIRDADAAMYRAKEQGRNRYALADKDMHRRMVLRLELERSLRNAIGTDELRLHYQPQIRLEDEVVTGFEALVRWVQPDGTVLGARSIIPVAEETGLVVPLGAWVLEEACRQAKVWEREVAAVEPLGVFVNVSARQLADPALVSVVAAALDNAHLDPPRLCLEVTESVLAVDADATVGVLHKLKDLGVRLAIDDFGTGYATLDYVRRFSMADALKIDQSFVAGLTHFHSPDSAIISAAIVLGDALGFDTIAEGVETAGQLAVLRRLRCAQAQGFYFARPAPADVAIEIVRGPSSGAV